ncbi:hypothetical protein [Nocardia nova]|uniref:hypothetical protein n=1 Tax=Nocardia nova TaxID=37330 RepID=UPI002739D601|nr:hypothetical protein [Nocardia nova]
MPEPTCCGNPMRRTDDDLAIYECLFRDHHPRYATPAFVEALAGAYNAGVAGEPLNEYLARCGLNVELDEDGQVIEEVTE